MSEPDWKKLLEDYKKREEEAMKPLQDLCQHFSRRIEENPNTPIRFWRKFNADDPGDMIMAIDRRKDFRTDVILRCTDCGKDITATHGKYHGIGPE